MFQSSRSFTQKWTKAPVDAALLLSGSWIFSWYPTWILISKLVILTFSLCSVLFDGIFHCSYYISKLVTNSQVLVKEPFLSGVGFGKGLFKSSEWRQNLFPKVLTSSIKTSSVKSWISLPPKLFSFDGLGMWVRERANYFPGTQGIMEWPWMSSSREEVSAAIFIVWQTASSVFFSPSGFKSKIK